MNKECPTCGAIMDQCDDIYDYSDNEGRHVQISSVVYECPNGEKYEEYKGEFFPI